MAFQIFQKLSYILFSDDTNIFMFGKNISAVSGMINKEFLLINEWLQINKLLLNISKTNYISI